MTPNPYSEDHLVEQPALALLAELGWQTACGLEETFAPEGGSLGRRDRVPGRGDLCHAGSGAQLAALLRGNHRYVFTLIQKFRIPELLCDRSDVVVVTDEAHRSQYDTLALNMPTALPKALFTAFTGTPLIDGEECTREVFGDYVSIYDFQQTVGDGATVPLFYENRTPELQLVNPDLNDDIDAVIEADDLDGEEEKNSIENWACNTTSSPGMTGWRASLATSCATSSAGASWARRSPSRSTRPPPCAWTTRCSTTGWRKPSGCAPWWSSCHPDPASNLPARRVPAKKQWSCTSGCTSSAFTR